MAKYTQIPSDTFKHLVLNAGILTDSFVPSTGTIGNLIGATTGGNSFTATPTYSDQGEDIDNCPKNMKELKKLDSWEAKISGTLLTLTATTVKDLLGSADIDAEDSTHIIPRDHLEDTDFKDLWFVGDYSDENNGANAGFIAIHMMNTLSNTGFSLTTTDKAKGQFAFEYLAHYSMDEQSTVPFEIFIKVGETAQAPSEEVGA